MGDVDKGVGVTLEELVASSLATADALAKLLIETGIITKQDFMAKLGTERAAYEELLRKGR